MAEKVQDRAAGGQVPERQDPARLEQSTGKPLPVEAGDTVLVLPPEQEQREGENWLSRIHRFHLNSRLEEVVTDPTIDFPLFPVAISSCKSSQLLDCPYPLFLADDDVRSFESLLCRAVENSGREFELLPQAIPELVRGLDLSLARQKLPAVPMARALSELKRRFAEFLNLSPSAQSKLGKELKELSTLLPEQGEVVTYSADLAPRLYSQSVAARRLIHREEVLAEVRGLINRLEEILAVDESHSPERSRPETLASTVGGGADYIETEELSKILPPVSGPRDLEKNRRQRIEKALADLRAFEGLLAGAPRFYLIHPDGITVENRGDWKGICDSNPFEAALGLFDGLAVQAETGFRALRTARLEVGGGYLENLHDEPLRRLSWEGLEACELLALPPILILESAACLADLRIAAFSRLLHSGRPVHVILFNNPLDDPSFCQTGESPVDWSRFAIAYQSAFVLQESLVQPSSLLKGLAELAAALEPGLVSLLASPPGRPGSRTWTEDALAYLGRVGPSCLYDPAKGDSWADCLAIDPNPQVECVWPEMEVPCQKEDSTEFVLKLAITPADAAAADPRFRQHLFSIPRAAWSDEQLPLAEYLEQFDQVPPLAVPFIWVRNECGELYRAILTRELAHFCRQRRRAWRQLQELAGIRSKHVQKAIDETRDRLTGELTSDREAELEKARREGAARAIDRLVATLLNPEALSSAQARTSAGPAQAPTVQRTTAEDGAQPAQPQAAETPPPAETGKDESFAPYIDSALCTSCNDCLELNPQMFKYNPDKQAYIADPKAGTYVQLVKAAEACPARCIHPGTPRPDDKTATERVRARAEAFN